MVNNKTIVLLHLYSDLMNLYGENGNVRVLAKTLTTAGHPVVIRHASLGDRLNFDDCDLVYIGCGSEEKQLLVLSHLALYREQIASYLKGGGLLLATGNAGELFGQTIVDETGKYTEALGLFEYYSRRIPEREVGEVLFKFFDEYLIGFQNRSSQIICSQAVGFPWFEIIKGHPTLFLRDDMYKGKAHAADATDVTSTHNPTFASTNQSTEPASETPIHKTEGIIAGGFLATSVLGLVTRNPCVLAWLADYLTGQNDNFELQPQITDSFTYKGLTDLQKKVTSALYKPLRSATSSYQRYNLALDVVAYRAFLANHHNIYLA